MKSIKILFGFDNAEFENGVIRYLRNLGYEVESTVKLTKTSIRDFLEANPSYDAAVLLEALNGSRDESVAKYTADELALLTDKRDINIVIVLNSAHKGSSYVETLYAAGITSAIYQKGRRGGATPREVAELIINKRSRRDARTYYGLGDTPIDIGYLGNDTFSEYYERLGDSQFGSSLLERFLNVCVLMTQKQIADFIRRLPDEVRNELMLYEEFYTVIDILRESGINMGIRRPKRVKIGLDTPEFKASDMGKIRLQIAQNSGIDTASILHSDANINRRASEGVDYSPNNDNSPDIGTGDPQRTHDMADSEGDVSFEELVSDIFGGTQKTNKKHSASYDKEYRFSSVEHRMEPMPDIEEEMTYTNDRQEEVSDTLKTETKEERRSTRKKKTKFHKEKRKANDFIVGGNDEVHRKERGRVNIVPVLLGLIAIINVAIGLFIVFM